MFSFRLAAGRPPKVNALRGHVHSSLTLVSIEITRGDDKAWHHSPTATVSKMVNGWLDEEKKRRFISPSSMSRHSSARTLSRHSHRLRGNLKDYGRPVDYSKVSDLATGRQTRDDPIIHSNEYICIYSTQLNNHFAGSPESNQWSSICRVVRRRAEVFQNCKLKKKVIFLRSTFYDA